MSIKEQAVKSVFWSAVERFSVQGIQFVLTMVIARVLSPDDYGLVAMLGIFMSLAQVLVDSGFANALVQKKDRSERDYSTAFYFNAAGAILVYLCLFGLAPLIAAFFVEPRLVAVTRVMGLTLVINSLGIVQQARLTVDLDFKRLARASLVSVLVSGLVGIWMAYHDFGVWTLVWQSLLNCFFRVVFLWIFSRWMPRQHFSWSSFRTLFSFGSKLMLSGLLHTAYTNCYSLIIGKYFSAAQLGFFNRAYTLAQFPSANFTNIVVRAVYPIQCRYQDDMPQLRNMFLKYMRMSCYLIFPVMVALTALAEPLVELVLTEKWLPAMPYLQILCIACMWDPVMKINHNILNVKGRTDYFLYAEIWKKSIAFAILFATVPLGVSAMCWGLVLYAFVDMGIIMFYSRKLTGIGYVCQFRELLPVLLLNAVTGVCLHLVTFLPLAAYGKLLAGALLGTVIYVAVSGVFRMAEWQMLLSVLKRKRG